MDEENKSVPYLNDEMNPFGGLSSSFSQIKIDDSPETSLNKSTAPSPNATLKSTSKITLKSVSLSSPDPLSAMFYQSTKSPNKTSPESTKKILVNSNTQAKPIEDKMDNRSTEVASDGFQNKNNLNHEGGNSEDVPLMIGIKSVPKLQKQTVNHKSLVNESFKIPSRGAIPTFNISLSNPRKVNDAINPYTLYRISTWTNSAAYKKKEFGVDRRFKDFLWLYEQLSNNNPGVIVPPPPEKHAIGRFQDDFIESRRKALETMLKKITAHPMLYGDPDVTFFLESESFAIEVAQRKKETSRGLFQVLGDAVSNATSSFSKYSEPDEWFESRRHQVEQLEAQLKALYKSVELVSKQRKDLGVNHLDFGEVLVALASAEVNKGLSKHFLDMGNLQKKLKDIQEMQSREDSTTIAATAELYLRSIGSIKACFSSRTKSYTSWRSLESDLEKKQTVLIKAQASKARPDKCTQLQNEVNLLERKAVAAKNEFEDISKLVKDELDRFDREKIEDFQHGIEQFLEKMIVNQKEIVKLWEEFINSLDETPEAPVITQDASNNIHLIKEENGITEQSKRISAIKNGSPAHQTKDLDTSGLHFSNPTSPDPLSPPNLYHTDENVVPLSPPEDPATSIWG